MKEVNIDYWSITNDWLEEGMRKEQRECLNECHKLSNNNKIMKEINRNWTKGESSSDKQKGKLGHCFAAQVWNEDGTSVAYMEPTNVENEASANAALFSDALNIANKTGLTPSELLDQRDELLETLKQQVQKTQELIDHCIDLGFIDWEDESIEGVKEIDAAILKSREVVQNTKNIEL